MPATGEALDVWTSRECKGSPRTESTGFAFLLRFFASSRGLFSTRLQNVANFAKRSGVMVRGRWLAEKEIQERLEKIAPGFWTGRAELAGGAR